MRHRSVLTRRTIACTALTVVLWASAFVAIRVAVPAYGALGLSVGRLLIASLALLPIAARWGVRRPARADLGRIALTGLFGMTAYQLLLNTGQKTVPAATAALLVATAPVITSLASSALLGERVGRRWWGVGLAFFGAAMVAVGRSGGHGVQLEPAALLVLGAAACQAGYFVTQKPLLVRYTATEVTCYAMWSGTLCALPFGWTLPSVLADAPWRATLALLWLGIAASAVGFVAWATALRDVDAGRLSTFLYLVAPTTVVIAWVLLGERPAALTLIGGAVALSGVMLAARLGRGPKRAGRDRAPVPAAP